jgi:hypothetical protein
MEGAGPILGFSDRPSLIFEVDPQHFAQSQIVFGQQNARFVALVGI